MGADGTIRISDAAEFKRRFPKVKLERLGLHEVTVLGQPAFITYFDESHGEPWDNPDCQWGPAPRYRPATGRAEFSAEELAAIEWLADQETFTAWT